MLLVAVVPQVLPVMVGTIIYRWDINIRESTVLGFVGANLWVRQRAVPTDARQIQRRPPPKSKNYRT